MFFSRLAFRSSTCSAYRQLSSKTIIQEGDVVLLKRKKNPDAAPILTLPLRSDRNIQSIRRVLELRGSIPESSIIGKGVRDVVQSTKGDQFRIHEPSLAEYVSLSPRLVTPIYPKDASLIVSLLDLHPTTYIQGDNKPPLEIFEAGTGHGSLTLYLSRAIHAANSQPPAIPPLVKKSIRKPIVIRLEEPDVVEAQESGSSEAEQPIIDGNLPGTDSQTAEASIDGKEGDAEYTQEMKNEYEQWLSTRRAIIQTLDISAKHSEHAQQIVRSYRRGLYYPNINFHIGTIQEYLSGRLDGEQTPFLDHAILDLPETDTYMDIVGKALRPNGLLLLFCPNITQINESVQLVKKQRLPFLLESVLEIGGTSGSGGREWDIKMVKSRVLLKAEAEAKERLESTNELDANAVKDGQDTTEKADFVTEKDEGWNMVCHPKFGVRTTVGAFIAVWRRMEPFEKAIVSEPVSCNV